MKQKSIDSFESFINENISFIDYLFEIHNKKSLEDNFKMIIGDNKEKSLLSYLLNESYDLKNDFFKSISTSMDEFSKAIYCCRVSYTSYTYDSQLHVFKINDYYISISNINSEEIKFEITPDIPIDFCLDICSNELWFIGDVELENAAELKANDPESYEIYFSLMMDWGFDFFKYAYDKKKIEMTKLKYYREIEKKIDLL